MGIDEAIRKAEESALKQERYARNETDQSGGAAVGGVVQSKKAEEYYQKASEYYQLADWLRELKTCREKRTGTDLISRSAAIAAAQEGADDWDGGCNPARDDYIRAEIEKVPAAEYLTGEWIRENVDRISGTAYWKCSNCGLIVETPIGSDPFDFYMNHCMDCGADMREGEKEDD